jgi:hypothetical protein
MIAKTRTERPKQIMIDPPVARNFSNRLASLANQARAVPASNPQEPSEINASIEKIAPSRINCAVI